MLESNRSRRYHTLTQALMSRALLREGIPFHLYEEH
uniref:Uncharacterized protein n=1 Tax=Nelumbo nucifera TaxID=4432 RepID=A0A822YDM7_NELNU|nr:TPA_asm: hypothetical protein HUJ06_030625 [Nelumbo nucifera]